MQKLQITANSMQFPWHLHDVNVEELKRQSVISDPSNVESGRQVAAFSIEGNVVVVNHSEVLGRVQPVKLLAVYSDFVADDVIGVIPTQQCGDGEYFSFRVRFRHSIPSDGS